jgi:hypothetical protein
VLDALTFHVRDIPLLVRGLDGSAAEVGSCATPEPFDESRLAAELPKKLERKDCQADQSPQEWLIAELRTECERKIRELKAKLKNAMS